MEDGKLKESRGGCETGRIITVKAGTDLPIVTRPTLDSREVLTRITQKETRRVMVFEREREVSRSSREMMVLKRERARVRRWERVHIRK